MFGVAHTFPGELLEFNYFNIAVLIHLFFSPPTYDTICGTSKHDPPSFGLGLAWFGLPRQTHFLCDGCRSGVRRWLVVHLAILQWLAVASERLVARDLFIITLASVMSAIRRTVRHYLVPLAGLGLALPGNLYYYK